MNHATALCLQACLDNELSATCSERMIQLIDRDSAARALCGSLMQMKELLASHRAELRIGHSREDYWARIEPAILAAQRAEHFGTGNQSLPGSSR